MTLAPHFRRAAEARRRVEGAMAAAEHGDNPVSPQPLPDELLPVEAFPTQALPQAFRPWVEDVAERMSCPADFVAVPLLVAAASLTARHVAVKLRRLDDWREPANLWALVVGKPGTLKSPAMRAALAPIERLETLANEAFNTAVQDHRTEALTAKLRAETRAAEAKKALRRNADANVAALLAATADLTEPTRRRYLVSSPTWEKAHSLLSENPGGLLMVRDEMSGWLREMGREENAEARGFFVQAWSGGSFTVDRIGRGTVTASDLRLSIVGAIQPGPLTHILRTSRGGASDDGLIERFLVAWPDDPRDWRNVDRLPDGAARLRVREVFERLDAASGWSLKAEQRVGPDGSPDGLPLLSLDDGALDHFVAWRADLEQQLRAPGLVLAEGALAKFRHHVPALALTVHLCDGGSGPVTESAMVRALALAEYFTTHAKRMYSSGKRVSVQAAKLVLQKALAGDLAASFTLRDVHRPRWAGLTEHSVVADALDLLVAHGWLHEASPETGGRPSVVFRLNEAARYG